MTFLPYILTYKSRLSRFKTVYYPRSPDYISVLLIVSSVCFILMIFSYYPFGFLVFLYFVLFSSISASLFVILKTYYPQTVFDWRSHLNWQASDSFNEFCVCLCQWQISKKDAGIYEVVLKDDRGKDTSTLNLTDQGNIAEKGFKSTYTIIKLTPYATVH